ncbi:phosphoprotein phosphatase methylesterase 1 KNAG_0B04550 [Huiozyma naganishii CBS 8797]|uniref:Protein phosphatase methylesterase 1 n=1 Tax=Huiozyma naganishii (strain ATCC MYA-139 / BCRC 22969 / CBS 8797 / KCTC 17520 / NBRC 10181 / NCYC 3082 / Yp74L-3) TaxID=1071383 RepID=J7S3T1_HUIN7|nr:hypothetical protein KNAG_0B04550 [Kazachstania naganishii CBS 8797]CCK68889.1 hypothetical protein KNAG_0B04550 [Kazachstania naganishii CBS 8797]
MADGLRRKVALSHYEAAQLFLDGNPEEEVTENDAFGDLPSTVELKTTHSHHIHDNNTSNETTNQLINNPFLKWDSFFEHNIQVELKDRGYKFNVYYTLPTKFDFASLPIFMFHHGAGSSGLTFASLAKALNEKLDGQCGFFSFDARGHGDTQPLSRDRAQPQYNRDDYTLDFSALIDYHYNDILLASKVPKEKISLILVGHSLGGSICTFVYDLLSTAVRKSLLGVTMLDIVEEAAIQALRKVDHFLYETPNVFSSFEEAVDWHVNHSLFKSRSSAEIAIPALFKYSNSGRIMRITDLKTFRPFWDTWFSGLSHQFVVTPTCKLLILAGNDNLDKELIVGQMQGKYQLVVFQDSGHFIQEDVPTKTALTLIDFWKRNDNRNVVIKSNWGKAVK